MASSTRVYVEAQTPALDLPLALWAAQAWARARLSWLGGELVLVVGIVLIGLVAHSLNMLHYPAFTRFDDEGIYAAQAWAVLRQGRLSPYTYWYDHAPAGWLLVAAWQGLTGGPHAFGGAIDSGRVLVLLLHLAMVPLLYRLVRKLGGGAAVAALAAFLFSVSPLAVFYQRLLLLDNLMLFWVLLSLDLLLDGWGRLSRVVGSGVCFGIALLSKETAIFLLPAALYVAAHQRWQHQGRFGLTAWLVPMLMVVSWYPLYAAVKGELLPAGLALRFIIFDIGTGSGVSLIDALRWQATRGGGGPLSADSLFWQLARTEWLRRDPLLFAGGAVAAAINLVRGLGWRDRRALAAGLLGGLPLAYLARGGVVFDFYVLFAIPFLCLNLAVLLAPLCARLPGRLAGLLALAAGGALVAGYTQAGTLQPLYRERPDQPGREALAWIKQYVPEQSRVVTPDALWTDLHEPGPSEPAFAFAHSHWKVASDPAVRGTVFHDDWRRVDYVILSPGVEDLFQSTNNTVALDALRHAHLVQRWEANPGPGDLHTPQVIELWKVDRAGTTEDTLLAGSSAFLADHFEQDGAYVGRDGTVTSASQADAMLRAVWSDDRAGFSRAWEWARAHLLDAGGLLSWLWRDGAVVDPHPASDADTDAALALLLAGRRWGDPTLLEAGRQLVQAIWEREVISVDGRPYLAAGDWAAQSPVVALNPGYFAPYAYNIFQQVDPDHDWWDLMDSSFGVLFALADETLGVDRATGLPPDWVGLDRTSGELVPLAVDKGDTTRYGYDAPRAYWRVALHLRWTDDGRAREYLRQAGFLRDEAQAKGFVSAVYARDGRILEDPPSAVGTAGAVAALLTLDPTAAHGLFAGQLVAWAQRTGAHVYWGDPDDLYTQEWGWFATALYADRVPDLWHGQR